MDLRLKHEYNYRILLKKYSCVRVSISWNAGRKTNYEGRVKSAFPTKVQPLYLEDNEFPRKLNIYIFV